MSAPSSNAPIREVIANLWDLHACGQWIAIPTNGVLRANGENVMGAGLAGQAAQRFPEFPWVVGNAIGIHGNLPVAWPQARLLSIPTKSHWRTPSILSIITESVIKVFRLLDEHQIRALYCPHLGCGLGQLRWAHVREAIRPLIDDRFIFVSNTDWR
ncbi:MAG: hypothetical protein OJF50_006408 [Nitrospira sp.]|jgi:hypothetical protein|nr:hypothetical protein [Nitrospira sp.]